MKRETYVKIYRTVYSGSIAAVLNVASVIISALIALLYVLVLVGMLMADLIVGLRLLAVTAIPFGVVTLLRHLVNSPRPYEVLDLAELAPLRLRGRAGHSFPSRHVASAMIVGGSIMPFSPIAGLLTLIAGVALGACRVLSGRHFLRDVIAGGAIGLVCGAIGALIVNF